MVKFDQMWFIFQHSLPWSPHTSSSQRCSAWITVVWKLLILKKVLQCRYDSIIGPILLPSQVFFHCCGTKNSQIVPNQENMEGDQPSSKPQLHTAALVTTDLCAGALSCWNRTPFISYPGCSRNVCRTPFSKSWSTYPVISWFGRKQCS